MVLDSKDKLRYSRHLSLPEIGREGQERLKASRVLVVGAGGLGCPAALYLAAAGIGTIGIIDPDCIELSNLQRQVLYRDSELGLSKVEVASARLKENNPNVTVETYRTALSPENAFEIIQRYDLVLDATDNFTARYLVNDACFFLRRPNVFASVSKFEGRLSVLCLPDGPCYRCLFPETPQDKILNCAEEGILGAVPGVMGTLQALKALKLILGLEDSGHRLSIFNFLNIELKNIVLPKNTQCPLCGAHPTIRKLESRALECHSVPEILPGDLQTFLEAEESVHLIDVREPEDFRTGKIPGSLSVPLNVILSDTATLPQDKVLILICQRGQRSRIGVQHLIEKGFRGTRSLRGGLSEWPGKLERCLSTSRPQK